MEVQKANSFQKIQSYNVQVGASNLEAMTQAEKNSTTAKNTESPAYSVSLGKQVSLSAGTYKMPAAAQAMMDSVDKSYGDLQNSIRNIFKANGQDAGNDPIAALINNKGQLNISETDRLSAAEQISEDGFWGAKNTSQRILDFAKSISGGDSSKADVLLKAFEDGYKVAAERFGGMDNMPQVSKDTFKMVHEGFEKWKNGANKDDSSKITNAAAISAA